MSPNAHNTLAHCSGEKKHTHIHINTHTQLYHADENHMFTFRSRLEFDHKLISGASSSGMNRLANINAQVGIRHFK